MSAGIDPNLNRLASRLWQLLSAKVAARIEQEVAQTQAELLEHAAAFRRGHGKIGEQVAKRLEAASERLVRELPEDLDDSGFLRDVLPPVAVNGQADVPSTNSADTADVMGKRPRGRPKKSGGDAPSNTAEANEPTSAAHDEVIDEERTGARDPAGADQVRVFSA